MSKVISPAGRELIEEFSLEFRYADDPNAGFGFPCDRDGNVLVGELADIALGNLLYAFTDPGVVLTGVVDHSRSFRVTPTVECDCGAHVHCDSSWANGCNRCGREYDGSGHKLAPRSQWGGEWRDQPEEDYGLYPHDPF